MVFFEFFEKVDFEKITRRQKNMKNFQGGKVLMHTFFYLLRCIDLPESWIFLFSM